MIKYGASFSVPYAEYLGVPPKACLQAALKDLGVQRLRLMSYWNHLEPKQSRLDFKDLDWQIDMAEKYDAQVTLCLGLRQPRWPENHWPDWALGLPEDEWQQALLDFIEKVVKRYQERDVIVSYQLENEAFNRSFGENGNFDRERLRRELELVKQLDPTRPVIMTTSNSWGIPIFGPRPDNYGFSIYRHFYQKGAYRSSWLPPVFFRLRAVKIRLLQWRGTFIHELQAEPWGPKGIPEMSLKEQYRSINPLRVQEAVRFAEATKLYPIDIWGLEWWYWLKIKHKKPEIWEYMKKVYRNEL
jgi:hypothetical protein